MNTAQLKLEAGRIARRYCDDPTDAHALASDIIAVGDSCGGNVASLESRLAEAERDAEALAEALKMQTPTWRKAGCWCAHSRDTKTEGHAENCDRARDALAAHASRRAVAESEGT